MSVLPSPIPHPLEFSPFDVPGWAYEALEWVVGFDWPAGNEVATWDVADRWYVVAKELAEPQDATFEAAAKVLAGYGGAGITADGFRHAFQQVAGDENAPLNALLHIADSLGELVEGCGRDLEAAKLEAWIEIGIFLTELVGMAITVALTFGAASPAAGGLIMATRMAIQQIFKRLVEQLGKKALKATAKRAVKEMATKEGLAKLGKKALHEGLEEAREEVATNGGIQLYQESSGRSHGFSFTDLGLSGVGGLAGGAAATGSGVGAAGHHGGLARGAGGEVLAEFGAGAAFGQLPGLQDVAKAGSSGASGSAIHGLASTVDVPSIKVPPGTPVGPFDPGAAQGVLSSALPAPAAPTQAVGDFAPGASSMDGSLVADAGAGGSLDDVDARSLQQGAAQSVFGSSDPSTAGASAFGSSTGLPSDGSPAGLSNGSPAALSSDGSPAGLSTDGSPAGLSTDGAPAALSSDGSSATSSAEGSPAAPSMDGSPATSSTGGSAAGSPSTDSSAGSPAAGPSTAGPPTAAASAAAVSAFGGADAAPSPSHISDISPSSPTTAAAPSQPNLAQTPSLFSANPSTDVLITPGASTTRPPLSDLDRIAAALGPAPKPSSSATIPRQRSPFDNTRPSPDPNHSRRDRALPPHDLHRALAPRRPTDPDRPQHIPSPPTSLPTDPIRSKAGYFGYAHHARRTHELNRRDEYINYLTGLAEESRAKILSLGHEADLAFRAGLTLRGEDHRRRAIEFSTIVDEIETQIDQVRTGRLAPAKVEVGPHDWARINTDVGDLAPGGVRTDDRSALTGTFGRPPIDRTRHYNTVGGLRAPLAVHQTDLENAVPRDPGGRPQRLPDPRAGDWFGLANDGGPQADPTRGLNCVDGVLALYDTYIHGRPRVSAPRTFDTYAHGNPDRPLGGETNGVRRIQTATGTTFQNLCPYVGGITPATAKPAIDLALRNLTNHLLNTGHGAYAFIITDMESGGSHAWAATNHQGTILFLDPQIGRITQNAPLYHHQGKAAKTNITSMDALVVDANGTPAPLPHHGPGQRAAAPTGTPDETPGRTGRPSSPEETDTQRDERLALQALNPDQRRQLALSVVEARKVAAQVSSDLHRVLDGLEDLQGQLSIIGERDRVKTMGSLARKVRGRVLVRRESVETVLGRVKDRVRFSVQVHENRYGEAVRRILHEFRAIGYRNITVENFWSSNGRHNGLNVNLTTTSGFVLEIQFPTPLSVDVGLQTHGHYEDVRRDNLPIEQQVSAFLSILRINRDRDIYAHVPRGLELLAEFVADPSPVDTTLASWIQERSRLATYREYLTRSGKSFDEVLREHDLDITDVPDMRGVI